MTIQQTGVSVTYKSPLHQMTQTTATCLWNDSAAEADLTYALEHGAVGATCNPVMVVDVLRREMPIWEARSVAGAKALPKATGGGSAWRVEEAGACARAAVRRPGFWCTMGRRSRRA